MRLIPLSTAGLSAVLLLGICRLWKRQKTFASCIKNLSQCVGPEKAHDIAYRLQDEEIIRFSKLSSHEIKEYAIHKKMKNFVGTSLPMLILAHEKSNCQ